MVVSVWTSPAQGRGWDLQVVCGALAALRRGADPYVAASFVRPDLSFPYLPTVAWAMAPVCAVSPPGSAVYVAIELAILAGSAVWLARGLGCRWRDAALLGFCAIGALDAGRWVALTGNPAILEAPLIVAAVLLWHRGHWAWSAGAIGLMASIKVLPVVFLLAYPLLLVRWWDVVRALTVGFALYRGALAFGLALAGDFGEHFAQGLVGGIPGQHAPIKEAALGMMDPNLPDFLRGLERAAGLEQEMLPVSLAALGFLVLGWMLSRVAAPLSADGRPAGARVFCLVLLVIAATLFRLKPYAFASLALLALGACVEEGRVRVVPLLGVMASLIVAGLLALSPVAGNLLGDYRQLIALILSVGVLLIEAGVRERADGQAKDWGDSAPPDPGVHKQLDRLDS